MPTGSESIPLRIMQPDHNAPQMTPRALARAATAISMALALAGGLGLPRPMHAADPLKVDFEAIEVGGEPDGFFLIDGEMKVEELDGGKVLAVAATPLVETGGLLGDSMKGGGTVEARVKADRKRRSYPRFGVGLHGLSGYRLRVVPSQGQIELVKNEETVKTEAFEWKPGEWVTLRLSVSPAGEGKWKVEGRVWSGADEAPEKPQIELTHEGSIGSGKASVWGTPYAGLPIYFDDVVVTPGGEG